MEYLEHHGILGMKWGVRRYQNSDGSLTELGKKRYIKSIDDGSYTLTKQGKKAEIKAFNKQNGRNAFEKQKEKFSKEYKDQQIDMKTNKSSEELKNINEQKVSELKDYGYQHLDIVKNGKLFTKEYFDTKISALEAGNTAQAAKSILQIRDFQYDNAKKFDKYDMEYLERASDEIIDGPEEARLKDYKSYLEDPVKWDEERNKR